MKNNDARTRVQSSTFLNLAPDWASDDCTAVPAGSSGLCGETAGGKDMGRQLGEAAPPMTRKAVAE
ncbi:unnamed protein product, partial [Amoebophrya sp. A25]|eukprot:GSA25T00017935001.1